MVLDADDAIRLATSQKTAWERNHRQMLHFERYRRTDQPRPKLPESATEEYRGLQERSPTPWADRIVTAVSDQLYVDGYRPAADPENASPWEIWQVNGLDAMQTVVHDDALAFGKSYISVLPGDGSTPVVEPLGIKDTLAVYRNPRRDEWPLSVLNRSIVYDKTGKELIQWKLIDGEAEYRFEPVRGKATFRNPEIVEHSAGVCPVVAFYNRRDSYGNYWGEIEIVERVINRLDQDTFDRLVVQRFGAWKVRTVTGMSDPLLDESLTEDQQQAAARSLEMMLKIGDILTSDSPDTEFGTLDETPLSGFLDAFAQDTKTLASMSDVPPSYLLGEMVEMSAEALAASEAGLARKVMKRQTSFGESWEQMFRIAAHLMGDETAAADFEAQVKWRQLEPRFLAQAADGLGKLAQMLSIPVQVLWERIPGWTQQDVERAKALAASSDELARLFQDLARDSEPAPI